MSETGLVLRTDGLSKQFGSLTVLRSVSLELSSGESLTVFGRNGAGKTSFLKIVAGLSHTYRGNVDLFGRNLKKAGEVIRRRIGFVSHETLVYPDLTTRENLIFYGRLYNLGDVETRVDRMLSNMGLEAKSRTTTRTLSRGMKQRLSLARAFLHEPDLLLLDEPFTGLDEQAGETLDELLTRFRNDGGSVLMASHNIERGWRNADRVVVLDRGAIAYETSVADTDFDHFRSHYRKIIST